MRAKSPAIGKRSRPSRIGRNRKIYLQAEPVTHSYRSQLRSEKLLMPERVSDDIGTFAGTPAQSCS